MDRLWILHRQTDRQRGGRADRRTNGQGDFYIRLIFVRGFNEKKNRNGEWGKEATHLNVAFLSSPLNINFNSRLICITMFIRSLIIADMEILAWKSIVLNGDWRIFFRTKRHWRVNISFNRSRKLFYDVIDEHTNQVNAIREWKCIMGY